jgi:hypothetical protein
VRDHALRVQAHSAQRNVGTYRELAILSRVCREFQTEAERKIYQSIVIRDKPFALSLCKLFAACPRVAGHVRQLSIEVSSSHSRNIIPNLSFNLPELVAHALAHASRLEALWYIQPGISLPRTPLPQVFNLVEAHLECDWDEHLMLFLEGQTRIVKLTLGDSIQSPIGIGQDGNLDQVAATGGQIEPPEGLHPGWLPNLKLLRGPWQIVMFLAQGRPLQDIKTKYPPWQLGDYDDIERFVEFMPTFLRGLGKSTARVMRLDLGDFLVDNISMVFMSEAPFYLPSLERVGRLPIPEAQVHAILSFKPSSLTRCYSTYPSWSTSER